MTRLLDSRLLLPTLLGLALLTTHCGDDKKPGFECDCAPGQVCREGVCTFLDGGTDAGDAGGDFIDNPDCPGSGIVINELVSDAATGEAEWVELSGPADRDLTGFRLVHINGNNGAEIFNVSLTGTIGSSGYFVISGPGLAGSDFENEDVAFQNGPDSVILRDCVGQRVDAVAYGNFSADEFPEGFGDTAPVPGDAESIGRCPDADDGRDNATDFHLVSEPTPGAANANFVNALACTACDSGVFDDLVQINEVLFDPTESDSVETEFIELLTAPDTDLTGLSIEMINGSSGEAYETLGLGAGSVADSDGFYVIGGPDRDAALPGTLQNGPDSIRLVDCEGAVVDAIAYGDFSAATPAGEGTPVGTPGAGNSLARCPEGEDTGDNANDFEGATPSPRAVNGGFVDPLACGGTPPCEADLYTGRLIINEVVPGAGGFVELRGDSNLGLFEIALELQAADGSVSATIAIDGTTDANGFASFATDDLVNAGGSVVLLDCEGEVVDKLAWGTGDGLDPETTAAVAPGAGEGLARCPAEAFGDADTDDNSSDFELVSEPTEGAANDGFVNPENCGLVECMSGALTDAVIINELLPNPDSTDTVDNEFIELRGMPGTALSGATIEVINGNGGAVVNTTNLIGTIPEDGLFVLGGPVEERDGPLGGVMQNGPDAIVLRDCEGVLIDAVGYGNFGDGDIFAGEGEVDGSQAAPCPGSGESLARCGNGNLSEVDSGVNSDDFVVSENPSPGRPNMGLGEACGEAPCVADQFDGLVTINEVRPGAGGFIELSAAASFDLDGLRVNALNDAAMSVGNFMLMGGDSTDANGFFTVDTDGLALSGGSVRMSDCTPEIVDAVAWGTGTVLQGEGDPAPAPSDGESIGRCDGAEDSNDNLTDFVIVETPSRNAANGIGETEACIETSELIGLVVINEVLVDPDGTDDEELTFIELRGMPGLSLEGAEVRALDQNGGSEGTVSLDGQTIPGDGYFVIGVDTSDETFEPDIESDIAELRNTGSAFQLWDGGIRLDALAYGDAQDALGETAATCRTGSNDGESLVRDDSGTLAESDTDDNAADWLLSTVPTPGAVNGNLVACPAE